MLKSVHLGEGDYLLKALYWLVQSPGTVDELVLPIVQAI